MLILEMVELFLMQYITLLVHNEHKNSHSYTLEKSKDSNESQYIPRKYTNSTSDKEHTDSFHCISELRVVSDANQLSILVEYIFIENVCVFMENR